MQLIAGSNDVWSVPRSGRRIPEAISVILPPEVAEKLSGHSRRRFLPTAATPLDPDDTADAALGSWMGKAKNAITHMPTRCSDSRDLVRLSAKAEVVVAAQWVVKRAEPTNYRNLTRSVYHQLLARDDKPNFVKQVMMYLASESNPTGDSNHLEVFTVPRSSSRQPAADTAHQAALVASSDSSTKSDEREKHQRKRKTPQ